MQKIVSKYGLAAHLALVAVAPLFLFPFCGEGWTAQTLLWLALATAAWVLMEPSRRSGEMLHDARMRVAGEIVRDPLFWVMLLVIAVAGARWANGGVAMGYDPEQTRWFLAEPGCGFIPGSVAGCGRLPFAAAVALAVVLMGCRHALGKSARVSFLFTASLLAGLAASAAVIASAFGCESAIREIPLTLKDAPFAGSAFGVCLLFAIVALAGGLECGWNRYLLVFSFAIGANATGLFFFAPAAVVVCYLGAAAVVTLVSIGYVSFTTGPQDALKCVAALLLAAALPVLAVMGLASADLTAARLDAVVGEGSLIPDEVLAVRRILAGIASKAWSVHPWLGTGLGSFGLDVQFNAADADWKALDGLRGTALNGWWQLLAERGIVGALMFAVVIGLLLFTFIRRLVLGFRRRFFQPACWLGPVTLVTAAVEAFVDASFLRPEMTLAVGAVLALSASSLPVVKRADGDAEK